MTTIASRLTPKKGSVADRIGKFVEEVVKPQLAEITAKSRERVSDARLRVIVEHVFFGSFANSLKLKFSPAIPTAGTNGKVLVINPFFVDSITNGQLFGLLLHEIAHVALGHHLRRGDRDGKIWNVACDYAINIILTDCDIQLPTGGLYDEKYRDWSSEQIYADLIKRGLTEEEEEGGNIGVIEDCPVKRKGDAKKKKTPDKNKQKSKDKQEGEEEGGSPGKVTEEGKDSGSDSQGESDSDKGSGKGKGADKNDKSNGDTDEGNGGDGDEEDSGDSGESEDGDDESEGGDEESEGDSEGDGEDESEDEGDEDEGEDHDDYGDSQDDPYADEDEREYRTREEEEVDWQLKVSQAETIAKGVGSLPGSLTCELDKVRKHKEDWRAILADLLTESTPDDYSYTRPNKLFSSSEILFPGLHRENIGTIVIGVDTSGSRWKQDVMDRTAAEISGILSAFDFPEVHVVYCDAAVNHVDVLGKGDPLQFKPYGGGGTDFNPVFDYVEREQINPTALIYITDLEAWEGDYPRVEPSYRTIWCAIDASPHYVRRVPFGTVVNIDSSDL